MTLDPAATDAGHLTLPLLDPAMVGRLRATFDELGLPADHPFHATSANGPRDQARAVDQLLKEELGPVLREVLPDHEPFLAAFISKGAATGATVDFHQDWTYTDEREHRAIIVWIPLVDTRSDNGSMHALHGSHRWTTGLRASGAPHATQPFQEAFAARAEEVPMAAGTAWIYDPALVHGSTPNRTAAPRPAAAVALAPRGASLVHFHVDTHGELRGWRIDESHYTVRQFASRPDGAPTVEPWDRLVSEADFAEHVG